MINHKNIEKLILREVFEDYLPKKSYIDKKNNFLMVLDMIGLTLLKQLLKKGLRMINLKIHLQFLH